jgi:hypothetical protein
LLVELLSAMQFTKVSRTLAVFIQVSEYNAGKT